MDRSYTSKKHGRANFAFGPGNWVRVLKHGKEYLPFPEDLEISRIDIKNNGSSVTVHTTDGLRFDGRDILFYQKTEPHMVLRVADVHHFLKRLGIDPPEKFDSLYLSKETADLLRRLKLTADKKILLDYLTGIEYAILNNHEKKVRNHYELPIQNTWIGDYKTAVDDYARVLGMVKENKKYYLSGLILRFVQYGTGEQKWDLSGKAAEGDGAFNLRLNTKQPLGTYNLV